MGKEMAHLLVWQKGAHGLEGGNPSKKKGVKLS